MCVCVCDVSDVTNDVSIAAAVQKVSSIVGPAGLNCLINNAATMIASDLNTVTRDGMMTTFQSNTVSPLFVTKVHKRSLIKAKLCPETL